MQRHHLNAERWEAAVDELLDDPALGEWARDISALFGVTPACALSTLALALLEEPAPSRIRGLGHLQELQVRAVAPASAAATPASAAAR
jgi:hypothetical protein